MHSILVIIRETSQCKQMRANEGCAIRQKNTQNISLGDAQQLCHLNTLTDIIRWLVTSIRRYVNTLGYRLLTSTTNTHLEGSEMLRYQYCVGCTGYHRANTTSTPT